MLPKYIHIYSGAVSSMRPVVKRITSQKTFALLGVAVLFAISGIQIFSERVSAAPLTTATLRFERLVVNEADVQILVKFRPNDITGLTKVRIDFDDNFVVNATASNITTTTTGIPSGECSATTVTNNQASAYAGGDVVDFDVTGVSSTATTYCFYITAGVTTPSSASTEYSSTLSTRTNSTELGSTSVVNYFVSDDQVTVNAQVSPLFTFELDTNSTSFTADLAINAIRNTTGVVGTVTTNAANGWTAYLKSTGSLHSTVANADITSSGSATDDTPTTISTSNNTEYYQLAVIETTDANSNGSIASEYDVQGNADQGGTYNSTAFQSIASGTSATSSYEFTMNGRARITGTTQAANDYVDTWTVIAAGNF